MAETVDASRVEERHDRPDVLERKVSDLHQMMLTSRYTVFYTGAGVSTSAGVGDYRGPSGAWTQRRIAQLRQAKTPAAEAELAKLLAEQAKERKKAGKSVCMLDAQPTFCHMAIAKLIRSGKAKYCVTTNLDGLFRKAGLRAHDELCFLHGDVYTERCTGCGYDFERNYETRRDGAHVHDHHVGTCSRCGSAPPASYTGRPLRGAATGADGDGFASNLLVGTQCRNVGTKDTHINFGECLDPVDLQEAEEHCGRADLCIVMGTSMSLRHITHLPFKAQRTVIVNLQRTPDDARCDLRVWAECDAVMSQLLDRLRLEIDEPPVWIPKDYVPVGQLRAMGVCRYYVDAAARLEQHIKRQQQRQRQRQQPQQTSACGSAVERVGQIGDAGQVCITTATSPEGEQWRWTIETAGEDVTAVEYRLHRTFTPSSVRISTAPFQLTRVGWGEFEIGVSVWMQDGTCHSFTHNLKLGGATRAVHALG